MTLGEEAIVVIDRYVLDPDQGIGKDMAPSASRSSILAASEDFSYPELNRTVVRDFI
jgi:hypothetical protein